MLTIHPGKVILRAPLRTGPFDNTADPGVSYTRSIHMNLKEDLILIGGGWPLLHRRH